MRVAGLGFRIGATLESLQDVLAMAERKGGAADVLATLPEKAGTPAFLALSRQRGLPVLAVQVTGVATSTHSARIANMHGTGSVAEAAALVAAGPDARLTVSRLTAPDGMATAAMAESSGDQR